MSTISALIYAERIAYSSKQTLHLSYEMARKFYGHKGVYVECGVAAGAQVIAMCAGAPGKTIYAFDSFDGIPLASNRDYERPGLYKMQESERTILPDPGDRSLLKSSGATVVSIESFKTHIKDSGVDCSGVIPVKGWFEDTVKNFKEDILILRLDGDLYNSTFVCLQNLFVNVVIGGCVIIDDWHLKGCQDACREYFNLISYEPEYRFESDIAYFFK